MTQIIDVEADSLEEARNEVMSQTPAGLQLLSETIISDGKPGSFNGVAETIEAAFAKVQSEIPDDAFDLEKKELIAPARKVITVEAFDEDSATMEANRQIPENAVIESLKLTNSGRKGFLGIGKKPNIYEAEVFQHAMVEIAYKQKAKITARVGYANRGMRQDTMSQATAYWMARMSSFKKDPFVMHTFENASDARAGLLELPCIHEDEDGGLICTETLTFGHYQRDDGITEAIVCGDDLTHELWEQAIASFEKHGGKKKNDLEPEERAASAPQATTGDADKVAFVREDRKPAPLGTGTSVYRIYNGPDAASAKAFLDQNPVTEALYFIIVETPEGNYCRDIEGFYKE